MVRMAIASKGRGKSGGARVITYTVIAAEMEGKVYLMMSTTKRTFQSGFGLVLKEIVKKSRVKVYLDRYVEMRVHCLGGIVVLCRFETAYPRSAANLASLPLHATIFLQGHGYVFQYRQRYFVPSAGITPRQQR